MSSRKADVCINIIFSKDVSVNNLEVATKKISTVNMITAISLFRELWEDYK